MARKPPEILEAERRGDFHAVLPPDPNHPYPDIGWRLFIRVKNNNRKWVWVHVQFGPQQVLRMMMEQAEGRRDFDQHLQHQAKVALPRPKESATIDNDTGQVVQ